MALTAGTIISLKGKQGDPGIDFTLGDGAPTGKGYENQGYIDDVSGDLYRYTGGAWVLKRNIVGPMGLNGINGQLLHGQDAPTTSTFDNKSDAIYIQYNGKVWYFDFEGDKVWADSGQNLTGQKGDKGEPGQRGTQIIHGDGPYVAANYPNAAVGDMYVDDSGPSYTFLVSA